MKRHVIVAPGVTLAAILALAGCGSSTAPSPDRPAAKTTGAGVMNPGSGAAAMAGSSPASATAAAHVIGTADWQEMKIVSGTAPPVSFAISTGDGEQQQIEHPAAKTSFQLTVDLTDARTGYAIPYARVQAEILDSADKVIYSGPQYAMISPTAGSYYGNNVTVPSPGHYTLKLTIDPPVAARHIEYAHIWSSPHQVVEPFDWRS